MKMAELLAGMGFEFWQAIPGVIGRLGTTELLLMLMVLLVGIVRIGVPILVIFLLYRWWKKRKGNS